MNRQAMDKDDDASLEFRAFNAFQFAVTPQVQYRSTVARLTSLAIDDFSPSMRRCQAE